MKNPDLISKLVNNQKASILKAIARAKIARDNSPSPMESHSDTNRSQNEKLVEALEIDLKHLESFLNDQNILNKCKYVKISFDSKIYSYLIVPDGLGGNEVENIKSISVESPLGEQLNNKSVGDKFIFNDREIEVLEIE